MADGNREPISNLTLVHSLDPSPLVRAGWQWLCGLGGVWPIRWEFQWWDISSSGGTLNLLNFCARKTGARKTCIGWNPSLRSFRKPCKSSHRYWLFRSMLLDVVITLWSRCTSSPTRVRYLTKRRNDHSPRKRSLCLHPCLVWGASSMTQVTSKILGRNQDFGEEWEIFHFAWGGLWFLTQN